MKEKTKIQLTVGISPCEDNNLLSAYINKSMIEIHKRGDRFVQLLYTSATPNSSNSYYRPVYAALILYETTFQEIT